MRLDTTLLLKVLSPRIIAKAMQAFDRATIVVVGTCWAAALVAMVFAIYTTTLSVTAKRGAEAALASEPSLPVIVRREIEPRYGQKLLERLQHRYPEIKFSLERKNLAVTTTDGAKFHQWLTALSYVDTITPEYHWSIQQLCVGKCSGEIMRAVLSGEHVSFEMPQPGG